MEWAHAGSADSKKERVEMTEIYKISQIGCLIYLMGMAGLDLKNRRIPVWLLAAGGILAVVFQLCQKEILLVPAAAGGAVGVVFLAVSKVTEEAFGYGDSVLIGVLGIYLGFWNLMNLLIISFLFASVAAMGVLIKRKFKRKTVLPFIPFLAVGYLTILLPGGF